MSLKYLEDRKYQAECYFCGSIIYFKLPPNNSILFLTKKPNEIQSEFILKGFYGWEVWKSDNINMPNCACQMCKNLIMHKI